ncbi:hypothetical protein [Streptomyces platensis]|uniref:hypothetical protein n=1 Tax=Streptomyces platensis TaxID=58346 RepID=UPI0038676316|nr:hypothetical protein OG962_30600 [Streptomyces platensis]
MVGEGTDEVTCALSLGALASNAGVATAASSSPVGPVGDAPSLRSAITARAAALDRCGYQIVRSHDSRYAYSVSGAVGGGTRELKIQAEDDVRVSGAWRKVTQVDACAGEQDQRPSTLRVTGKLENPEHYDPSVPRTIHSDASGIPPAARTHAYWIRAVKDGFVSDLRAERPLTIEP